MSEKQPLPDAIYATIDLMENPAIGGASVGVWGRNPSAVMIKRQEVRNIAH
jgi:hypothetical protein